MATSSILADVVQKRLSDCKSFTKIVNVPNTASGVAALASVSGGGVLVELLDAYGLTFTPNRVSITFLPVLGSIYNTNLSASNYSYTGYGWVQPWRSNMQTSSAFFGMHPDATLPTGAAAYGQVALLGKELNWTFSNESSVRYIQLFNKFGANVVAYINYSHEGYYSDTGTCGR